MQMTSFRAAATAALLTGLAAACARKEAAQAPKPPRAELIQFVPTMLGSQLRDTTGTDDAERRTYAVDKPLDSVRTFYRTILPGTGWGINGDQGDSTKHDIYARKGAQALWVHVTRVDAARAQYTLIVNTGGAPALQTDTAH